MTAGSSQTQSMLACHASVLICTRSNTQISWGTRCSCMPQCHAQTNWSFHTMLLTEYVNVAW